MVGTETAFAVLLDDLEDRKWIATFGEIRISSIVNYEREAAYDAMEIAQKLNADFRVVDIGVICVIDGIETIGSSYVNAAMQAVVSHQRRSKTT